ncbi:LacI family DNA-binding transcriptional regulator [Enemella evansiae]|uniref:LacI family DNA-binding transcriptional regulator n=1 Tax=Enemella evansiae TaxID=2016499 RepID=UPI000B977F46|nr:LacI family DNA-binding transcriptional regulator [Enemella evansiae]OYO05819.1 LacI family transcriptional regulator [Enemella evansiae]OYO20059.1 LacI family transcriptional regulator [Enemella evansiae]PFG66693.1 LacI family transcriptional regulator [Propionibacteriaceae bacterium ES.041]
MSERAPTLKDVAAAAGVAVMTASRAFARPELVSPSTREKVITAANSLGYRHNALAAAMRTQQSGLVGVIVTNIENPFHSKLAQGIDQVLTANGRRMLLGHSQDDAAREAALIADMRSWRVEGLIAVPALAEIPAEERFAGTPTVLAGRRAATRSINQVTVDDEEGARLATADLIDRGARRIGFIGNEDRIPTTIDRLAGYRAALADAGFDADEGLVRLGCRTVADARSAVLELRGTASPDALFCVNNQTTIGALQAYGDTADPPLITGFDDLELADLLRIPTTLVSYDPVALGADAANLLLKVLARPGGRPRQLVRPVTLHRHEPA